MFNNIDNKISPIVGVGSFLRFEDRWYLGISIPNLLKTTHYETISQSTASEEIHLNFIAGYVANLSKSIKFKPTILSKIAIGSPIALDATVNFMHKERFILGAAYRWDAAVSALAGFYVNSQVLVGYAYDYDTTDIVNFNNGSHEVYLRFQTAKKGSKEKSIRFF